MEPIMIMTNKPLILAVVGGTAGALILARALGVWPFSPRGNKDTGLKHDAAFPTAQWVAAMRAVDAASENPKIGSNIGMGPDVMAESLAGELGYAMLDDMLKIPVDNVPDKVKTAARKANARSLIDRTMAFDEYFVDAMKDCKQFVIIAAGLDSRAWRLPFDVTHTVYEVDCDACFKYKEAILASSTPTPKLACGNRITVDADLADATWVEQLKRAGFNPDEKSLFLVEGLLMYLPEGAPEKLMKRISDLMAPSSILIGDTLVDVLSIADQSLVKKYGTEWTWDTPSEEAFTDMLVTAGLQPPAFSYVGVLGKSWADFETSQEDKKKATIKQMEDFFISFPMWPGPAIDMIISASKQDGTNGLEKFFKSVLQDKRGMLTHILDGYDKDDILKEILTGDLPSTMEYMATAMVDMRAKVGGWRKFVDVCKLVWTMSTQKKVQNYVVYRCVKH